ncbi:MAG: GNAT family N-acetyltransferase [Firmicutes bacterium]|nr:GNAT family N-acetyltransferase [Bacillota bacterium]
MSYNCIREIDKDKLKALYENAGWILYIQELPKLIKAMEESLMILSAWDDNKLVGLVRVVGDGQIIIYIQDILVLDEYKRNGIATNLLNQVLDKYKHVRQKVLLTNDSKETRGFYTAEGFTACDKGVLVAFVKLN